MVVGVAVGVWAEVFVTTDGVAGVVVAVNLVVCVGAGEVGVLVAVVIDGLVGLVVGGVTLVVLVTTSVGRPVLVMDGNAVIFVGADGVGAGDVGATLVAVVVVLVAGGVGGVGCD